MQMHITIVEGEIRQAICDYIRNKYGVIVDAAELPIEVKSKQNYRSEWEGTRRLPG